MIDYDPDKPRCPACRVWLTYGGPPGPIAASMTRRIGIPLALSVCPNCGLLSQQEAGQFRRLTKIEAEAIRADEAFGRLADYIETHRREHGLWG